jgi:hypothetical protein
MRLFLRSGLAALITLAVCAAATAQTTSQVQVIRGETRFQSATRGAATLLRDTTGGFPVPGLGFDYTHHAAVNRDFAARALIDPATQQQLALARQLRREAPGIVLPFIGAPQVIVVAPPPVVIVQQPAPAAPPPRLEPEHVAIRDEPVAPPVPPRELEEILLVCLDGRILFAVAFTVRDGEMVYITPEGIRRSLLLSALDREFTLLLNEERGTTLHLPS